MNTIQCWITREPKGEYEDEYSMHFSEPLLTDHYGSRSTFWSAKDSDDTIGLIARESYGLNHGECMEWVMVKKGDFEKLKQDKEDLFNQVVNTHQSLMAKQ